MLRSPRYGPEISAGIVFVICGEIDLSVARSVASAPPIMVG